MMLVGCSSMFSPPPLRKACLPIYNDLSSIHLSGKLFLTGKETYILSGYPLMKSSFPIMQNNGYSTDISNFITSPDHEKAAYIETYYRTVNGSPSYIDQKLKILLSNGEETDVSDWQPTNEKLIEWFDNDRLLISLTDHSDGTISLLNPFTGERQDIQPSFSDIYKLDPIPWYESNNPLPLYNSSRSLVFYLRNSANGMELVLRNLKGGETLWSGIVHNPTIKPQWSPTQDRIMIAIPQNSSSDFEFYSIDKSGQEARLSNLSSVYRFNYIGDFSWSPNARYISFWLDGRSNADDYNPRFALLDLTSGQVIDYCIGQGGGSIFWSPDGNQVALKVMDKENISMWYTVVVDIQKNVAVKIANQEYPIGWTR